MSTGTINRPYVRLIPKTRVSRGGLDEINPEDIVYGEYSSDNGKKYGEYLDLVYLDGEILRTFSGRVVSPHPVLEELKILLRDDEKFYLIPIKEVESGFAFKRNDITDIKVSSLIPGNHNHEASCVWTVKFEDRNTRALEINYQAYFSYGNTLRPNDTTNIHILEKVFPKT